MAFSAGSSGGGFRGKRRFGASHGALAEINIIPLVDVVLVLLIIFMLTAHVMDYGLQVDVPKVKTDTENSSVLPTITITRDQSLYLNERKINIHDITAQLNERFKGQTIVYVAADSSIRWDVLAQVVAELGVAKITPRLVTKPLDKGGQ